MCVHVLTYSIKAIHVVVVIGFCRHALSFANNMSINIKKNLPSDMCVY